MELKFSVSGIPYIEFDDDKVDAFEVKHKVRLVFVKLTNSDTVYRYVTVKGYRSTISAKRKVNIIERNDFVADVTLNGFPNGFTGDECHNFTKHKHSFLKKVLKKYVVEDGDNAYLPANLIKKVAKDIEAYREPKRRLKKVKKKRVRRSVVHLTDEVIAEKKAKKEAEEEKKAEKEKKIKEKALKKREKEIEKIEKELNGKSKKRRRKTKLSKTCKSCGKELFSVPSCNSSMIVGHNKRWIPIVHKGKKPCKACGVMSGGRHHLHCPHEKCPRCKGKFASCGCF